RGITFCTMITSSAIYPNIVPPGKLEEWASRDAAGHVIPTASWNQGCLNNPGYRAFVRDIGRAVIDGGADGIHYDESYSRWFWMRPIPCFCDACCAELRSWLRERYSEATLRERWGIDNIQTFDYRGYLAEHGWADEPWRSPLHDDWWLMQLHSTLRWEKWIVDDNKAYARQRYGRDLVTNANQFMITTLSAVITAESQIYDFVNVGTGLIIDYRDGAAPRWLRISPAEASFIPLYRMGRAHAPDKPVVVFLDIQEHPEHLAALPPRQEGLYMQWLFAEAHLSSCYFAGHHRFSFYEAPLEPQVAAGQFFKRHAGWYKGSRPVADIGVLFSFPSQIWDMYANHWSGAPEFPSHSRQYYGVCQALLRANLQFDTVFIGDGDIFPGSLTAVDLAPYRVVIAPGIYAANDAELEALHEYLRRGGYLVITGPFADYDGLRRERGRKVVRDFADMPRVVVLSDDLEPAISPAHADREARLVHAVVGRLGHQPRVLVNSPQAKLQVHIRRPAQGNEVLVDVINTDFDWKRGFRAAPPCQLWLRLDQAFRLRAARLFTIAHPEGVQVPLRHDGDLVVLDLPEVESYALVVLEQ
ncbi:MAG: beta-galactosidase, partial [Armatimonadetes bacterium]|nr:beta-galactosidase [Armatimonadota bacterium]